MRSLPLLLSAFSVRFNSLNVESPAWVYLFCIIFVGYYLYQIIIIKEHLIGKYFYFLFSFFTYAYVYVALNFSFSKFLNGAQASKRFCNSFLCIAISLTL